MDEPTIPAMNFYESNKKFVERTDFEMNLAKDAYFKRFMFVHIIAYPTFAGTSGFDSIEKILFS